MTPLQATVLVVYFLALSILAVYGWHRSYLLYLYIKFKDRAMSRGSVPNFLPRVTVQLPIYNEMYVVERLIDAVCRFDYPLDRLEIQVLDDSTDETQEIIDIAVRHWTARGRDIKHLRRSDRIGFKAGALADGLKQASGEFIAVFDADFIPPSEFLKQSLSPFKDPDVGLVQSRWGHVNQDYSLLTSLQASLLDGHFVIEHGGRNRAGLFFNFNGTGGLWRRDAIESAGGWEHDTLTEDLDLSYRAQLIGWKFVFLSDVVCPAELPVEMNAFKSQQRRWAKGSVQTCWKILPKILKSNLSIPVKLESVVHLTANINYLLMAVLSIMIFPAMVVRHNLEWNGLQVVEILFFCTATLSLANFYAVAQGQIYKDWFARLKNVPILMALGIGLSVNNARAVIEAMFGRQTGFVRTPKYGVESSRDAWMGKRYRQAVVIQPFVEIGLGVYFVVALFYALRNGIYSTVPILFFFQVGFFYTGALSIIQQLATQKVRLET